MRIHHPIAIYLISLAPFSTAFTLPHGLTNGNYAAFYNATGHEVHMRVASVAELNVESSNSFKPLEKRQDPGLEFYCGCGLSMNHGDCDDAVAKLKSQFPATIPARVNYYSISGSVVVS
jgi:hypothetical protein